MNYSHTKPKINKKDKRIYDNLFIEFPIVKQIDPEINEIEGFKLLEPINTVHFSDRRRVYFAKSETRKKFIYIFGVHNAHLSELKTITPTLIIDFNKTKEYDSESLGIHNTHHGQDEICLNKKILDEKYPDYKLINFNIEQINSYDNNFSEIDVIKLGILYSNFPNSLEKFLIELSNISQNNEENPKCIICKNGLSFDEMKSDKYIKKLNKLNPQDIYL